MSSPSICPNCGTEVQPDGVNAELGVAWCAACDTTFELGDALAAPPPPPPLRPDTIEVVDVVGVGDSPPPMPPIASTVGRLGFLVVWTGMSVVFFGIGWSVGFTLFYVVAGLFTLFGLSQIVRTLIELVARRG